MRVKGGRTSSPLQLEILLRQHPTTRNPRSPSQTLRYLEVSYWTYLQTHHWTHSQIYWSHSQIYRRSTEKNLTTLVIQGDHVTNK